MDRSQCRTSREVSYPSCRRTYVACHWLASDDRTLQALEGRQLTGTANANICAVAEGSRCAHRARRCGLQEASRHRSSRASHASPEPLLVADETCADYSTAARTISFVKLCSNAEHELEFGRHGERTRPCRCSFRRTMSVNWRRSFLRCVVSATRPCRHGDVHRCGA